MLKSLLSGLRWDMASAKAYIGAALAAAPPGMAAFLIGLMETTTGFDIPVNFEGIIGRGVAAAVGFLAVYFTSNDLRVAHVDDIKDAA